MKEIVLNGYETNIAPYDAIELGTYDSYGEEQLQIVKATNWENLNVIATFNPPNKKPVQVVVDSVTGIIKVPKEATADLYGVGTIVFVGLADGVQRISTDVRYNVRKHSNANGTEPAEPTPSVVQQILTEAQNANVNSAKAKKLATNAKDIAQSVRDDADNGKFNGKDGAKGDKGETGTTPQLKIGEDNLWNVSYDNGETWVSLGVKATGDAGKDGVTPHIGENGNWWVGDTDTGVSAKGDKGDTGAKGADGVSPTASVTQTDDGAEFTVTDASGTTTAMIRNGTDGKDGAPGAPGKDAVVDATLTQDGQAADAKVTGEKIGQLKKDLSNKITKFYASNQGETHLADSDNGKIMDMMVYGKSSQDGTPTPDNPVEIKSVVNPTVDVCGKNLFNKESPEKSGYIIAVDGTLKENKDFNVYIYKYIDKPYTISYKKVNNFDTFRYGIESNGIITRQSVRISPFTVKLNKGERLYLSPQADERFVCDIQIELGSAPTAYEPYHEQTVTLPYTLNAIPVTSGGNVTIDGQQYVADYVDVEKGKLVRTVDSSKLDTSQSIIDKTDWLLATPTETDLTADEISAFKAFASYYPVTNVSTTSDQLDGYTVFNYPISLANGWNYVKQQIGDTRDYLYDIDLITAEAYVNSAYATAIAEMEV